MLVKEINSGQSNNKISEGSHNHILTVLKIAGKLFRGPLNTIGNISAQILQRDNPLCYAFL